MPAPDTDRLIADDLESRLSGTGIGSRVLVFRETASTNDIALQMGAEGAPDGTTVFAETQTAGRGRFGRKWHSASGDGLWFSVLLRPDLPPARWPRYTLCAALAVARGIEECAPSLRAGVKWPNDVYLAGRKACGILVESCAGSSGGHVVIGIGVNVNQTTFDAEIDGVAISVRQAAGHPVARRQLAATILLQVERARRAASGDFAPLVAEARARSTMLGRFVRLRSGQDEFAGVAEDLDEEGALLLRTEEGGLRTLCHGEITVAG